MDASQIAESVLQAAEIIAEKKTQQAGYDMTIKGTILSCEDESKGKYRVKYQDSILEAYSDSENVYSQNASVYLLVPNNNFNNRITILGLADKNKSDTYDINVEGTEDAYEKQGIDLIGENTNEIGLHSYLESESITLYDCTAASNLLSIDTVSASEYLSQNKVFILSGDFRTALATEQQEKGNYGLKVTLEFLNASTNETKYRQYIFDLDDMIGQPFNYVVSTTQTGIYDFTLNFNRIYKIEFFSENFPNTKEGTDADIFVSNISLYAAAALGDNLTSYYVSIATPQGTFFKDNNFDELNLMATLKENGKVVGDSNDNLYYYWFIQDTSINSKSDYYNSYGGQGWKCLNTYKWESNSYTIAGKTISTDKVKVWDGDPDTYSTLTIVKSDVIAKEVVYKCVIVYNKVSASATQTIKNMNNSYTVTIQADGTTSFNKDIGQVTLKCIASDTTGEITSGITYAWGNIDVYDNFTPIADSTDLNTQYTEALAYIENAETEIKGGAPAAAFPELETKKAWVENFKNSVERVDGQYYYNLQASQIEIKETYLCSAYYNGTYIGTGSIVITNGTDKVGYNLKIDNNNQVFKYSTAGVSPTSESLGAAAQAAPVLGFILKDEDGTELSEAEKQALNITWAIPNTNSMLVYTEIEGVPSEVTDDYIYVYNVANLAFNIQPTYDASLTNNTIRLSVLYNNQLLTDSTMFTFIKEGEPGTNGTEYSTVVSIAKPKDSIYTNRLDIPIVEMWNYQSSPVLNTINFNLNNGKWFEFNFYHNGELIFKGTTINSLGGLNTDYSTEGYELKNIKWEILQNKKDTSIYTVTSEGVCGVNSFNEFPTNPTNIIKVSFTYNDVEYTDSIPIASIIREDGYADYHAAFQTGGFISAVYSTDGKTAAYDTSNPFDLRVFQDEVVYEEKTYEDVDISLNEDLVFDWECVGNDTKLEKVKDDTLEVYQYRAKPLDDYNGYSLDNGIICIVTKNEKKILEAHIPVHLSLNRYGNSAINGWDGNTVALNDDGDVLLAPQIGAGQKNEDNTFTGLVMGVKQTQSNDTEVGLFAFNSGQETIFLDAKTGKAKFGVGKAAIVLDPTTDEAGQVNAYISANYNRSDDNGTGLMINLAEPSITFGSGNFEVTKEGKLYAKSAEFEGKITAGSGQIANWTIDKEYLYEDFTIPEGQDMSELWAHNVYIGRLGIRIGDSTGTPGGFYVTTDGKATATDLNITGGTIQIGSFKVDSKGNVSASSVTQEAGSFENITIGDGNYTFYAGKNGVTSAVSYIARANSGSSGAAMALVSGGLATGTYNTDNTFTNQKILIDTNGSATFNSLNLKSGNASLSSTGALKVTDLTCNNLTIGTGKLDTGTLVTKNANILTVGTSGGQYATITSAIEAAKKKTRSATNHVTIYIMPGTYSESLTLTTTNCDYIDLIGFDAESTIITSDGVYPNCTMYINGNHIIDNLSFINTLSTSSNPPYAVYYEVNNALITGECTFNNCIFSAKSNAGIGIGLSADSTVTLNNCVIKTSKAHALYFHNNAYQDRKNQNLIVKNCILYGNSNSYSVLIDDACTSAGNTNSLANITFTNCSSNYPSILYRENTSDTSKNKKYVPDGGNFTITANSIGNNLYGLEYDKRSITETTYTIASALVSSKGYAILPFVDADKYSFTLTSVTLEGTGEITSSCSVSKKTRDSIIITTTNAAAAGGLLSVTFTGVIAS